MEKSHLDNIKETGMKTPEVYFDTFDERLFKKLDVQKKLASISGGGHKVPDNYFENFNQKFQIRLKNEGTSKVRTLISWRNPALISGVAASLLLMFAVFSNSTDNLSINQIETVSIEDYLNNENLNAYDIASFLNEDDLDLDHFVKNTLSEESLENYLLNNASIEDLITEK